MMVTVFLYIDGNGCVAKAGTYLGGCLGWLTYADSGCACFAECHVYNICCNDIDWIKCSCQNVRDIYGKDESICNYGKFSMVKLIKSSEVQ